jgi:hypothetical protein
MAKTIEEKKLIDFYNENQEYAQKVLRGLLFSYIFSEDDIYDIAINAFVKLNESKAPLEKKFTKGYFYQVLHTSAIDFKNIYYPSIDISGSERQSIQTVSIDAILNDLTKEENSTYDNDNNFNDLQEAEDIITHSPEEDNKITFESEESNYGSVLLYAVYSYKTYKDYAMMRRIFSQFISKEIKMHQSLYETHDELNLSNDETNSEADRKANYIFKHMAIQQLLSTR